MLEAINIPGAVVAGGCIRDCFLAVEPKDIDIFIPVESREDMTAKLFDPPSLAGFAAQLSASLYGTPKFGHLTMLEPGEYANPPGKRYTEYDDAFGEAGDLFGVAEGEFMGYAVNIIGRKAHADGLEALIGSFDFNILQAAYDGKRCHLGPGQAVDQFYHRATMAHDRHVEQSIRRFFRFNTRHPGLLSLVVPFEYEFNG
jgi:hypothetical protein